MASTLLPGFGLFYKWSLGESGWNTQHDANLKKINSFILITVLSATTTAPPGSPANGDRYIVPTGATGDWVGEDGNVAVYDTPTAAWEFYAPVTGWQIKALDSFQVYQRTASAWVLENSLLGQYADDAAAAAGSVPVDGVYVNSSTGALTVRLV